MLSSGAHFFKALAARWSAEGLTGNYDTEGWAIRERYSWKRRRFVSSCTYKCKLPRSGHLTHLTTSTWSLCHSIRPCTGSTYEDNLRMTGFPLMRIQNPESDPAALSEPTQVEVISSLCKYHFSPSASDVRFLPSSRLSCLENGPASFTCRPGEDRSAPPVKKMKGYAACVIWKDTIQSNYQNRAWHFNKGEEEQCGGGGQTQAIKNGVW